MHNRQSMISRDEVSMSAVDLIHNHSAHFHDMFETSFAHILFYLYKFISFSSGVCLCRLSCTTK